METIEQRQEIAKKTENHEGPFKTKRNYNKNTGNNGKEEPTDMKQIGISKKNVVSEGLASRFVRGKDLKTVDLIGMFEAL